MAQLFKKMLWTALCSGKADQNHLYALLPSTLAAGSVKVVVVGVALVAAPVVVVFVVVFVVGAGHHRWLSCLLWVLHLDTRDQRFYLLLFLSP